MIFDINKALSLPDIRNMVAKRDGVLKRFGPLFRDPARLTRQDYLDFLSFKHNHHWSGLERLGRRAADDMNNLRSALTTLVDEALPLSERFDTAVAQINGVGSATLTPILLVAYDDRYGVWNGTSEPEMRDRGLWPSFPHGATQGEKYELINARLVDLARDCGIDLWTLDALWWADKLERQNAGHYKDAWFKAVWQMATQAELTAKQANGQTVDRIVKNKDLRLSKEALITHLKELLDETGHRCAITGLALQADGPDDQLHPSLDRIDSNGHYEAGNLQVVARFINFWKQAIPDAEFRRQLAMVRGE
ncbi:hypothetical protein [Allomesorhizobium alhagi]|uniref:Uncharacterized protein n=1 Tax=Mesorhizobium alhagi CCNWXJ12-2 TaxID=1107882 RepID=H0HQB0_9HYPH|nr:hypothetical protein [Mesorhizobium alhagi]EHK57082.1 hypothetical protein MAXJ12_11702 [Mesorhizobium alhagi CCNWXJ12-2]